MLDRVTRDIRQQQRQEQLKKLAKKRLLSVQDKLEIAKKYRKWQREDIA